MPPVKHAIISAAGLGSRLEMNMPKCLVEIGDEKIIEHQLALLRDVEDVRITVGFMEEEVIECARRIRPDIIFVRNPDYSHTSNSYSLYLATRDLKEPFVALDGDLLIDRLSFENFLARCHGPDSIIGITESKTEDAVFVELENGPGSNIRRFTRTERQPYEWCGIAYLAGVRIRKEGRYIFEELEPLLPLKTCMIDCFEIDTPEDLHQAYLRYAPHKAA